MSSQDQNVHPHAALCFCHMKKQRPLSLLLLKQATKKKNERLITQCFGVLITPLSSEIGIIHYYSQANARDEKN